MAKAEAPLIPHSSHTLRLVSFNMMNGLHRNIWHDMEQLGSFVWQAPEYGAVTLQEIPQEKPKREQVLRIFSQYSGVTSETGVGIFWKPQTPTGLHTTEMLAHDKQRFLPKLGKTLFHASVKPRGAVAVKAEIADNRSVLVASMHVRLGTTTLQREAFLRRLSEHLSAEQFIAHDTRGNLVAFTGDLNTIGRLSRVRKTLDTQLLPMLSTALGMPIQNSLSPDVSWTASLLNPYDPENKVASLIGPVLQKRHIAVHQSLDLLATNGRVLQSGIVKQIKSSDHKPVYADIEF